MTKTSDAPSVPDRLLFDQASDLLLNENNSTLYD
jgi:hypothetical protein